jgi:hypothetical protein
MASHFFCTLLPTQVSYQDLLTEADVTPAMQAFDNTDPV